MKVRKLGKFPVPMAAAYPVYTYEWHLYINAREKYLQN